MSAKSCISGLRGWSKPPFLPEAVALKFVRTLFHHQLRTEAVEVTFLAPVLELIGGFINLGDPVFALKLAASLDYDFVFVDQQKHAVLSLKRTSERTVANHIKSLGLRGSEKRHTYCDYGYRSFHSLLRVKNQYAKANMTTSCRTMTRSAKSALPFIE